MREDNPASVGARRLAIELANLQLPGLSSDGSQQSYSMLVEFLVANGVIPAGAAQTLLGLWESAPEEAAGLLLKAASFRAALRRVFEARISRSEVNSDWVDPINELLAYAEGYDRIEPVAEHIEGTPDWRLTLHSRTQGLEWLLTAIARSAAELITEGPQAPIRVCANPNCGLFFYDDSRTGRRRWCSMAVCGNRAKVAAHYRREKTRQ